MLLDMFRDNACVFKKSWSGYLSVRVYLWRDSDREAGPGQRACVG